MTRVPPSGGPPKAQIIRPPSSKPAAGAPAGARPQAAPGRLIRRSTVPKHVEKEKPGKVKTDEAEGPPETGKPQEGAGAAHDPQDHARLAEAWQPESHAEKAEEKQKKDELHEEEKAAEGGPGAEKNPRGFLKQIKPALKAPNSPVQQQGQKAKDGFEGKQGLAQALKTAQAQQTGPAAPVKGAAPVQGATPAAPAAPAPRPSRPPDAFAVLHAAQDPGVFFKEEGHNGPAEQGNPELSAAIEEAIRLLFGVRGILRVSGGFNKDDEPAIIVVATQGFGESSMKLIPPRVHRFETILAVPYDMLPLKRERL